MNTEADLEAKKKYEEMVEAQLDAMENDVISNPEDDLKKMVEETETEKEEAIKENPYYLGELEDNGFKTDGTGVYKHFQYQDNFQTNDELMKLENKWMKVTKRAIHLKISRNKDKQCEIKYSWVSRKGSHKEGYTYKELMSFTRPNVISDAEIDAIATNLHQLGEKSYFKLDKQDYQTFTENVVSAIKSSSKLDVFKNKNYIFPSISEYDDGIANVINARVNPVLTDEEKQEALEVENKLKKCGFKSYMDTVLQPKHIGDNKNIMRKVLAEFVIINGWASYFLMTDGMAEAGKTYEDELALSFIPNRYIYRINNMTGASFTRYGETHDRYFDRLICVFGDLGSNKAFEELEKVFNIIKILITENEYKKTLSDRVKGSLENIEQNVKVDSIGAVFQTTKFDFLDVEGDQLASRTIKSTPAEVKTEDVIEHIFARKSYKDSPINQKIAKADEEIKRFQLYLLHLITKEFDFVNPWETVFKKYVIDANTPYRNLEQVMDLFKAYCTITHFDCDTKNNKDLFVASKKQVETFMNDISLENTLPPSESEFLKMLMGKGTKKELEIIKTVEDENTVMNSLNPYFNDVLECMGYSDYLEKDEIETVKVTDDTTEKGLDRAMLYSDKEIVTIDTLREDKQTEAIKYLLQFYRLAGSGLTYKKSVFFTVKDVKRAYGRNKPYKNIDDVPKLLNKFYKNGFIDKLDYKDKNNQNIYYLTSKCETINNNITVDETDVSEAKKYLEDLDL